MQGPGGGTLVAARGDRKLSNTEGALQFPQGCCFYFLFIQNIIKAKLFQWIFITDIFKNKFMEGKRLNSKNKFDNEKKNCEWANKVIPRVRKD